ncbi:MAG: NAD(P)-binding domain-containing protein [Gammaproteobacteria bacterium]|nr:NAD(P)-binding domain-containing protein [Gammaproteobacteria bacterium]
MRALYLVLALLLVTPAATAGNHAKSNAASIAIIGTGEVGSALGVSWGRLGHPIIYGSRNPDSDKVRELVARSGNARAVSSTEAAQQADIVVMATPFKAALELIPRMGSLDGKILIDPMNALTFDNERQRVGIYSELVAEQVQALAKGARVVKALSLTNARNMNPDRKFPEPISVPLAGDDPDAKAVVIQLVEELGLDATDVGALYNARYLEAMAPLYVYMNAFHRSPGGFEYHFTAAPID